MERLLDGRYRIGPVLGNGGMAVVYQGYDTLLGRHVAIKVLREQYAADPTFVARFEREAKAVAAFNYPNIVNIFDVGNDFPGEQGASGARRYFVMEYIDGPNLKEYQRARGLLPIEESVGILTQVLAGLGYAHARALVHRDVKPQNIMLTSDGVVKVTDFGIAKGLGDTALTDAGMGMGTVAYISPEQAQGEPATPASDLYAVGVMLYELLTGVLPFTADTPYGIAVKHVHEAPIPPHRRNPAIPQSLSALTMRALAKDPQARFLSAKEFAAALNTWPNYRGARNSAAAGERRSAVAQQERGTTVRRTPQQAELTTTRAGVGWLTWALGTFIFVGLVVLLYTGYQLSPFGAAAADVPTAVIALPTQAPVLLPTAQPTVVPTEQPTAVPIATPTTAQATATRAATPTQPPSPTITPTVGPTQTATPVQVTVPDFVGKTLEQAQSAAQAAGLTVEQVEARFNERPAGQVIEQRPAAGGKVAKGSTVTVVVSRGPQQIKVPDVKNTRYEAAAAQLDQAGLAVARKDVPSRNVPKGVVIDQDPLAGNSVKAGTTVTLTVSLGDVVEVPDLFGMEYQAARAQLDKLDFKVSINGQTKEQIEKENPNFFKVYPDVKEGRVISQSIAAGTFVERGGAIAIAYYKK